MRVSKQIKKQVNISKEAEEEAGRINGRIIVSRRRSWTQFQRFFDPFIYFLTYLLSAIYGRECVVFATFTNLQILHKKRYLTLCVLVFCFFSISLQAILSS